MTNMGIYGQRSWQRIIGQNDAGSADVLNPIGALGDDDTISINAIPTFTDNVNFTLGLGEDITVVKTNSAASGTVRSMEITHTQTVQTTGVNECLYVDFESAVQTGNWTNAIVGRLNYTAPGNANGGMAAAICSELSLAGAAQTGGAYYSLDVELDCPTSFTCAGNKDLPVAMQKFGVWGNSTAITSFETNGYLFHLDGFTAGNDKIFATVGDVAAAGTLRINIGGTDYYILIATATS